MKKLIKNEICGSVNSAYIYCLRQKVNICSYCSLNSNRNTPKRVKKKKKKKEQNSAWKRRLGIQTHTRSTLVYSVHFGPCSPVRSTLINFDPVQSNLVHLLRSTSVHSVHFSLFGPIRSISLIQVEVNYFFVVSCWTTLYMMRVELINDFPIHG